MASWQELSSTVADATASDGRSVVPVQYYVRDEVTVILGITADDEPKLALVPGGADQLREILLRHFPTGLHARRTASGARPGASAGSPGRDNAGPSGLRAPAFRHSRALGTVHAHRGLAVAIF